MRRVRGPGFGALLEAGLALVPERVLPLVECEWFLGADPLLAGLHTYTDANYGRSYSDVAHTVYEHHQPQVSRARRAVTVVMPHLCVPSTVVHELGHVLHERLGFEARPAPTSWYARTNRYEAFAEAWTSWLVPGYGDRPDEATLALFEELAAT